MSEFQKMCGFKAIFFVIVVAIKQKINAKGVRFLELANKI